MSSNIGPEAQAAYSKYLDAERLEEKIKRLEEFISLVPKHKATEKIVALNKSRLAKLKRELEDRKKRSSTAQIVSPFSIKKEGTQLILISAYYSPGVGKTSLLNYLTGAAKDQIGRYTPKPEIGVYKYEKIRFQVVDMPPLMENASKGVANGKEILSQLRACDLILICVDLSRNIEYQMDLILTELNNADIRINVEEPPIDVEKTGANKIQIFYLTSEAKENIELTDKIKEIIYESGLRNAMVKIYGDITLNDLVDALNPAVVYKKAMIIGTKGDLSYTEESFEKLEELYSDKFPIIIGSSVQKAEFPDDFGESVLNFLNKIKIFTMNNGIVADKPLLMDKDHAKVRDVARKIHKSFVEKFDYALIIRKGARQEKKRVGLDYELQDEDIIELHTI
ncbi:MAG: TGS domain-containing protein [Promethearchaeota archaeon]|nr:MAG: TGS domain-containing protein [Candidatus Lokiarchaeota archaeon]